MFEKIINGQKTLKDRYINGPKPPEAGISIQIKNNKIVNVIESPKLKPQVRKQQYIALINNTLAEHAIKDCFVNINLNDMPQQGYFNFCRHFGKTDEFLLPNHRFTQDDIKIVNRVVDTPTFNEQTRLIRKANIPYAHKINKFFTMTQPFGIRRRYLIYSLDNIDICDGILYLPPNEGKNTSEELLAKLKRNKMVAYNFKPFITHTKYKYVIYIDGATLSDRMRLLLCLNSVIIKKITEPKWEEFYSFQLKPEVNFISYNDESELRHIHIRLECDPELCKKLITNNRRYINNVLTYKNIKQYVADIINAIC